MLMVEYHPGVMVLPRIRLLTHVEPLNALRQHNRRGKWRSRHQASDALSGYPLKAHQQCKLALHRGGECQSVPQKFEHRL